MADLETVTSDDARAFYRRWYHPANAAVVIAGDVDVEQVRVLGRGYVRTDPCAGGACAQAHR